MKKTAPPFTSSENALSVQELAQHARNWIINSKISQHSQRTIEARSLALKQFFWFLDHRQHTTCGLSQLREFFVYLNEGHTEPGGRWGNPQQTKPLRPVTVATFHKHLRTFYNWMLKDGIINVSPMERIPVVSARYDQIQPFTQEQVNAMLEAAKRSNHPKRDRALVLFLFDTGLRATEVCNLKVQDVDFGERQCSVLGKGNKYRTVNFGQKAAKALWAYKQEENQPLTAPLFLADRGSSAGESLTRSGLFQLIQRLGAKAGVKARRCSPHTFRHTFAVEFLRNGGNTFTLKQMLGHTSLHMTNRYVALAQADLQRQHAKYSPADNLR